MYDSNKDNVSMLKSRLFCYSDVYILVKGTIAIFERGADEATMQADERNKEAKFRNCSLFTDCVGEINNTEIDNAKDLDVVIPIYNFIEYSNKYSKTSGSLWKYYRDEPNDTFTDFKSFKSKINITGKNPLMTVIQKFLN